LAPEYSKEIGWLNIFISPYPYGIADRADLMKRDSIDRLLRRTKDKIPIPTTISGLDGFAVDNPLSAGHTAYKSIVLRDTHDAGILDFSQILELYTDGRAKLFVPINSIVPTAIKDQVQKSGIHVVEPNLSKIVYHDYGGLFTNGPPELSNLKFFNFPWVWAKVLWLLLFYQEAFREEVLLNEIKMAIRIENPQGYLVAYVNCEEWVMNVNQRGLPLFKDERISIPEEIGDGIRIKLDTLDITSMLSLLSIFTSVFGLSPSKDFTMSLLSYQYHP
jgi:hypothetical protein